MSLIVAARFPTFDDSADAVRQLRLAGISDEAVHTFYVNTPGAHAQFPIGGDRYADPDARGGELGAVAGAALLGLALALLGGWLGARLGDAAYVTLAGAGLGAYVGALFGALWLVGRRGGRAQPVTRQDGHPAIRPAGVMLAVQTPVGREQEVARLLRDAGGTGVERAQGRWVDGEWLDFDPLTPPRPMARVAEPGDAP